MKFGNKKRTYLILPCSRQNAQWSHCFDCINTYYRTFWIIDWIYIVKDMYRAAAMNIAGHRFDLQCWLNSVFIETLFGATSICNHGVKPCNIFLFVSVYWDFMRPKSWFVMNPFWDQSSSACVWFVTDHIHSEISISSGKSPLLTSWRIWISILNFLFLETDDFCRQTFQLPFLDRNLGILVKLYFSLFPGIQLIISYHWCRW